MANFIERCKKCGATAKAEAGKGIEENAIYRLVCRSRVCATNGAKIVLDQLREAALAIREELCND